MSSVTNINTDQHTEMYRFNTCTLHLLLLCAVTNECIIHWQFIILLLHVLTLLCRPQGVR